MSLKFVSRGGEKLEFALENFQIDVRGKICADFGSSKGGFVDCLLQRGAKKVYAIDTGYGELDWKLRNDKRVVVLERTNALYFDPKEKMDFISIDVGWTRQKLIIPVALKNLNSAGDIVSLLKPHYESDKKDLRRGKAEEENIEKIIEKIKMGILKAGGKEVKIIESPLLGKKGGNREFLIWVKK